ncbi:hypothetical protein ULMA_16010 [Patiriisocius marinus]|uniref:Uncharacterized protein n=1 Tax=Patiriisocius marinus TaxID=1397112 RepID=A0A5J4J107_9FLAO|nr:hypothetical protein [Patiriisocius marinus]GER59493.1 hypothetical protein ULMA_16010 [Patiriisocius marinus]
MLTEILFFIKKRQTYVILISLYFFTIGCQDFQNDKLDYQLRDWLLDREKTIQLYNLVDANDCENAELLFKKLKGHEFIYSSSMYLARCYIAKNNKYALRYVKTAFDGGYNIKLLDSVKFKPIWQESKKYFNKANPLFWKNVDTSYFQKIENLVFLDQYIRRNKTDDYSNEVRQDSLSSEYLTNFCNVYGFPRTFYSNNFESYREIDPTILAIHSNDNHKEKIIQCAIESALDEKISWLIPIVITKSFYVAGKLKEKENPLFLLKFDNSNNINYTESLLQLYVISELYNKEMPSKIYIRPSKLNNHNVEIIEKQLKQIKNYLINNLNFDENNIQIINKISGMKAQGNINKNYLYTIQAVEL